MTPFRFKRFCPLPASILYALIALFFVWVAPPVYGQSATPPSVPQTPKGEVNDTKSIEGYWTSHFDDQIAPLLRMTPSSTTRTRLLHTVINVAVDKEDLTLSKTIPTLLHIIEEDADPQRRLLALQALDLISEQTGVELGRNTAVRVYELMEKEPSPDVRRAGTDVLTAISDSSE